MTKNIIPEIARLLGVEIGEEFKVGNQPNIFKFSDNDFEFFDTRKDWWWPTSRDTLVCLLNGKTKIVKLPWKPKNGETYYTYVDKHWLVVCVDWADWATDFIRLKCGMVFRTEEEALRERPRVYKELTGEEWKDEMCND